MDTIAGLGSLRDKLDFTVQDRIRPAHINDKLLNGLAEKRTREVHFPMYTGHHGYYEVTDESILNFLTVPSDGTERRILEMSTRPRLSGRFFQRLIKVSVVSNILCLWTNE